MEQLNKVLPHVKDNTLINVPERRRNELIEQFFPEKKPEAPNPEDNPEAKKFREMMAKGNPFADVNMWPELAYIWMSRLFS